jgi:4-diphosphocytidyl-2-C-methyl-D-erythritol kinase
MICYPNAKINLGLHIVSKRDDGFHNIETIFYPIGLCDILEIIESPNHETTIETSGLALDIQLADNICLKAYHILAEKVKLPGLKIYLHKIIPSGAGLGGGSSDASFLLKEINKLFKLGFTSGQMQEIALELGSDCAFFVENKPVFASGRGEIFRPIEINLSHFYLYIIKPDLFVSTAEAYKSVTPTKPENPLFEMVNRPIEEWKHLICNDFEKNIFAIYPQLAEIKAAFYQSGAIYASMSGSGSAVYGIFKEEPEPLEKYKSTFNWISRLE